ncbi:MAG: hypothetical protein V4858_30415 [Pseudomonadota bacterium]
MSNRSIAGERQIKDRKNNDAIESEKHVPGGEHEWNQPEERDQKQIHNQAAPSASEPDANATCELRDYASEGD